MPRLQEILVKAYAHTKNHRFLWFFGLFMLACGVINFLRLIDFRTAEPTGSFFVVVSTILVLVIVVFLDAVSRAAIIHTTLFLERQKEVGMQLAMKNTRKYLRRVFLAGLLSLLFAGFIVFSFALPLYYVFATADSVIFLILLFGAVLVGGSIIIANLLIHFFAVCFIVVYDLSLSRAFQSSTDLFIRYWERMIGLFLIVTFLYSILFLFSASLIGLISVFALSDQNLIKSIATPISSLVWITTAGLSALILFFVNSLLNVFSTVAWTLFFLKIVKAKRFPELEEASLVEPVL
jgi:hypothetical protein